MGSDIPLGRIAGIKVGMHVSVFLVAGLYAVLLAELRFPQESPDLATAAYWIAGIGGALLLFLSLLVHEIGHALVARDEGIGVHSMALTLLGGVTRMESSPTTAGAEFRVSVVGPVASATCGIVFLVSGYLMPDGGYLGLVGNLFSWLGLVNLFLTALNLVPAAPLDGGKVLSSMIWKATGSQTMALTWTAGIGVVLGMAAFTWGLREITRESQQWDLAWSALVLGGFIGFSAFQQLRSAPLYRSLDGRTVAQAMAAGPPSAPSWATVGEFLRSAQPSAEHQAYPVVGPDGQVSGLLTAAAIRATPPQTWDTLSVTALAYPLDRLTLVRPEEPLLAALQKVETGDVRQALVVGGDGRIVGTLDPSALDRALAEHKAARQPAPA